MLRVHFHCILTRKLEVRINCGLQVCSHFYKTPRSQRQPETPRDSGRLTKDTQQLTKDNTRDSRWLTAAGGRRQMSAVGEGLNGQLAAQWNCGQNYPLVYRGKNGQVCHKLRMVTANLLWNCHDKRELRAHISRRFLASGDTANNTKAFHVVARLTGLPPKDGLYNRS